MGFLLEEVMVFGIAGKATTVALAFGKDRVFLHDGLQIDADVCVLFHSGY